MPRSNASFLGQLLGTSEKITASALDSSVIASLSEGIVTSDISGITGAGVISNIVSLTQADYDAISTPDSTTLYVITG